MPVITRFGGGAASTGLPEFTYTGTYSLLDDGNKNWRIKFLTSGTLTFDKQTTVDIFCVGGGGRAASQGATATRGAGGGYTKTYSGFVAQKGASYNVVIGAGASSDNSSGGTSYFSLSSQYYANGGLANGNGGSGGGWPGSPGGAGGTNGSNSGYTGQGSSTKEFGGTTGNAYGPGGGGGATSGTGGSGGATGGGNGGGKGGHGGNAVANTGGGGGGCGYASPYGTTGNGGSGIVIIRNHRTV